MLIKKTNRLFRALLLPGLLMTVIPDQAAANNAGEDLYRQHCAACHGYDGNGGVGVPLTLPDFQYSVTNSYLKKTIRYGRPGRVMPAFPSLSNADIKAIIKYIRRWAPGKPYRYPVTPVQGNVKHGSSSISNTARPVMARKVRVAKVRD